MVEPDGYCPRNARLSSGTSMLSRSAPYSARVSPRVNGLGSKPGVDTSATTSPLLGSIATTAPRRPMRPCSATSCVGRSIAVITSLPAEGLTTDRSALSVPWRSTERPAAFTRIWREPSVPCRSSSYDASMPSLPISDVPAYFASRSSFSSFLTSSSLIGRHVAERVHRVLAVRIEARETRRDVDARELEAVHGEARDLLVGEAQPDRHALEAAARADEATRIRDVVFLQDADLHQTLQRGIDVGHALAHQLELERGPVLREDCPVADRESGHVARARARRARGCPAIGRRNSRSAAPAAPPAGRSAPR
jgi:hypothetical protein